MAQERFQVIRMVYDEPYSATCYKEVCAFGYCTDNLVGSAVGSLDNTKKGEVTTVRFITTDDLAGWRKVKPLVDYQG